MNGSTTVYEFFRLVLEPDGAFALHCAALDGVFELIGYDNGYDIQS
jgi:hypothetical protein